MRTLLLEQMGVGMVSQFPLDIMHLVDIGVTRKMLQAFLAKIVANVKIDNISSFLLSIKSYIPSEFSRYCRSLDDLSLWKATECRQFLLYTGMVALKGNVDDNTYYHFLLLMSAIRLLVAPSHVKENAATANCLLAEFVKHFPAIYGNDKVTYNVHGLLHLADDAIIYGPLDSFSCYKFENFMQFLKKDIRKPSKLLQQLHKRIAEQEHANRDPPKCKFDEFTISTKENDCFCLLKPNISFRVIGFKTTNNQRQIYGKRCLNTTPFFKEPVCSKSFGIIQYSDVSSEEETFFYSDILYKFFRMPFEDKFVLVPILHHTFSVFTKDI